MLMKKQQQTIRSYEEEYHFTRVNGGRRKRYDNRSNYRWKTSTIIPLSILKCTTASLLAEASNTHPVTAPPSEEVFCGGNPHPLLQHFSELETTCPAVLPELLVAGRRITLHLNSV